MTQEDGDAGDEFIVLSEPDLVTWGAEIGRAAQEGSVFVALYGQLGAGKSTVVRAACRALGVRGQVPSPTFTLVNLYEGDSGSIQHVDLYRLDPPVDSRTLIDAGWPAVLEAEGPVFVEWADRAEGWLPADRWDVWLRRISDPEVREVSIESRGTAPPAPRPASPLGTPGRAESEPGC